MKVIYPATSKMDQPTLEQGIKINYAQSKRGGYQGRWYLLILVVISPVLVVSWFLARPYLFILAPGVLTTEPLAMRAPEFAVVGQVLGTIGQTITKGQVLIQLDNPTLDARIDEIIGQQRQLNVPLTAEQQAIINQSQQRIKVAELGLSKQQSLLVDFKQYQTQGLVPLADMAVIIQAHTAASMAFEQAKADYLNVIYQQKIEQESGTIAQLKLALARELSELTSKRQQLAIMAPFSGRISDIQVQAGEYVNSDLPLLWLSSNDQPVIQAYLDPKYLDFVGIGQKASVKLPNGDIFDAEIREPTELVGRLPKQLMGPFDGEKPVLKVTLTPLIELAIDIEGIPVEVTFDHDWQW
ncbi:MAG: HlyD family secretion protein [Shewanella sp.]